MNTGKNLSSAKKAALSGILMALSIMSLFVATVAPTNRIAFYALSSFPLAIVIIELGVKSGWFFYLASCLLAAITVRHIGGLAAFIGFFGIYGIVKFYIERLDKIILEHILKIIYFNLCLAGGVYIIKRFFIDSIQVKIPWWFIIIALQVIFLIYDYVYTLFIQYYNSRLRKILR